MIKVIGFLMLLIPTAAISQNFIYADTCAGSDIGAKINTCRDSLPLGTDPLTAGYRVGTIILPNTSAETNLKQWSTKVILGPGVNLMGQGMFASAFTCTVNNDDCLVHDATGCSNNDPKCGFPL